LKKGEATRSRIVEAAARQVAVRGIGGVSLGDLAEVVGLSKSGLFKHFDSKDEMNQAVVEAVLDRFRATVWTPVEALPPGRPRVEAVFKAWLHWGENEWADSGCPIHALSIELDDQPGPLRDYLQMRLQRFRQNVVDELRRLRDPPLTEAEAQAAYFQMKSFILGHGDSRRMMGDLDAERSALMAFEALLDRTSRVAA
jgi:AcrR family transcriptional regulator